MQAKILYSEYFDDRKDFHYSFGNFVLRPLGSRKLEVIPDHKLVTASIIKGASYDEMNDELDKVHLVSGLSTPIALASGNGIATLLLGGLALFARSKRRVPLILIFDDGRSVIIESTLKFADKMIQKAPQN
ncbi:MULTISPECIES: hypothetical protein [unclassified Moraxella]|uniref:hypothetical protein n=1 Tax=unclassified Moraxella TaxID=2685852 RepID=UPI002B40A53A|nr:MULTISPECIES: hypothetical protein [unclassified Moraxella]